MIKPSCGCRRTLGAVDEEPSRLQRIVKPIVIVGMVALAGLVLLGSSKGSKR